MPSQVDHSDDKALMPLLPADPMWHRPGDLSYRGRNTEARNPSWVTAVRCLSSPSIWSHTWGNWDWRDQRTPFKVTELVSERTWKRTPRVPAHSFCSHSSPFTVGQHHGWQGASLMPKWDPNRHTMSSPCSPSSQNLTVGESWSWLWEKLILILNSHENSEDFCL